MLTDFLRYSCQLALPGFSEATQVLLQQSKVLIVGAGGLGCPAAQYLTAMGVGTLGIADFDLVSVSNLHRQVLYNPSDVGLKKATVACDRLQNQNPEVKIVPHATKITSENVFEIFALYDIIIDGTDNFETRYLLNDAAVLLGKPIVYGAIYQFEGQLAIWNVKTADGYFSPNYRDLFPQVNAAQIPNCADGGVIPTLAGIIGCMQANEVIKLITNSGDPLIGKVMIFNAQTMHTRTIKIGDLTKTKISQITQTATIPTISLAQFKNGLESDQFYLIDVRTIEEHEAFDFGGLHIPLENLEDNLEQIKAGHVHVIYCNSGKRSSQAVILIKAQLADVQVFSLEGGLNAWIANP